MTLDRTIILDSREQLDIAIGLMTSNWRPMRDAGHTIAIRCYEHKEKRNDDQNRLYWALLGDISQQVWIGGKQFHAETWAIYCKRQFLPDEEGPSKRCRKGYRKFDLLPDGDREMIGSTTQLTTAGFAEYLEQIMAHAATEWGVRFPAGRAA